VVVWWSAEPTQLSIAAEAAISGAEELAMAAITWYELAWLTTNGRIDVGMPVSSWFRSLARTFGTLGITPAIAETAAALPATFPGDPVDRLIYATAVEYGCQLVTKDQRLRDHPHPGPRPITVW